MDPVLIADELTLRVARGDERRIAVAVHNPEGSADHYRFEILGDAARWGRVEPRHVPDVPGGGQSQVELVLRPPADTPAGATAFALRCVSLRDAERCAVLEGEAVVGTSRDLDVATAAVAPVGRSGQYLLRVRNRGSGSSAVQLSAADPRHELAFAIAPRELTVAAGDTGTAYLSVRPRRPRLAGRTLTHRFSVEFRAAAGAPDRFPVRFDQRPVLGLLAATAAALLTAVLVVAAAALAWPSVRGWLPGADPAGGTAGGAVATETSARDGLSGFYVLWSATPVGDVANAAAPDQLVTLLQGAGVPARVVDSRTTAGLGSLPEPAFGVVQDGFPDLATAAAACAQHRDLAPNCTAMKAG